MEKKQIVVDRPVQVSGLTVLPVVQTSVIGWHNNGAASFFGLKKPIYLLVSIPGSPVRAFAVTGEPVSLDQIISLYPGLKQELETFT